MSHFQSWKASLPSIARGLTFKRKNIQKQVFEVCFNLNDGDPV